MVSILYKKKHLGIKPQNTHFVHPVLRIFKAAAFLYPSSYLVRPSSSSSSAAGRQQQQQQQDQVGSESDHATVERGARAVARMNTERRRRSVESIQLSIDLADAAAAAAAVD
jgi:uncharacterized protein YkwD